MFYKLKPVYKDYLWGSTNLKDKYHKDSKLPYIAESWELANHKDGKSELSNTDKTLQNLPIMIKFLDVGKPISIQVHPNDEYAKIHEHDLGKTECWYIVDAKEDAYIYYGFNREINKKEFLQVIENDTILDCLQKVYVKPGECYFIDSGTIHSTGKDIIVYEVQESSNSTYRIYDYNRTDKNGHKRELHLDKAMDAINFNNIKPQKNEKITIIETAECIVKRICKCKYFVMHELKLNGQYSFEENKFCCLTLIDGEATIKDSKQTLVSNKGDSYYIEPNTKLSVSGKATIIITLF